jgi:hypothetical protein
MWDFSFRRSKSSAFLKSGANRVGDSCPTRKGPLMIVYQEEIAPPGPLPDPASEPADVLFPVYTRGSRQRVRWVRDWMRAHPTDKDGEPFSG